MKGTEQGHPLSPDLFKIFLSDLSPLLEFKHCPTLSNLTISHLLWADDLILLSTKKETTQMQLKILQNFCDEWGIEINELKTQAMIFGNNTNTSNLNFNLYNKPLEIVDSYCYLGIVLHKSGSLVNAQVNLKDKAMRALFGLKRVIMRSKLSFKALITLFDSLIKPIILYGAPLWTPTSSISKSIIKSISSQNIKNVLSKISNSTSEKPHLSFLKWALGVHRKSSNVGIWGESGRFPLIYQSFQLTLNYYKRLCQFPEKSIVSAALKEQKQLRLPWYKNIESMLKIDKIYHLDHVSAKRVLNPNSYFSIRSQDPTSIKLDISLSKLVKAKPLSSEIFRIPTIISNLTQHFKDSWTHDKSKSSKLSFYNDHKVEFGQEPYLDLIQSYNSRCSTTKLRISAHDLQIEVGRHTNAPRELRACQWCEISMGEKIIECENHLLFNCDLYASLRSKLIEQLNKSPSINLNTTDSLTTLNILPLKLKECLMKLLSPNTNTSINEIPLDQYNIHHKLNNNINFKSPTLEQSQIIHRRAFVISCICSFISHCFDKRKKFIQDRKSKKSTTKSITFNIFRSQSHLTSLDL